MSADELKAQGNSAFAAKDYGKAVDLFTQAIAVSNPANHVLFSNRSGAYAAQKKWSEALADAEECVRIKPDWSKGWSRKGAALHGSGELAKAADAYDEALRIDPSNAQAKSGKKSAEDAMQHAINGGQNSLGSLFSDPSVLARLHSNPRTSAYMNDPSFLTKLQAMAADPMSVLSGGPDQQDPRLMEAFTVALGIEQPGGAGQQQPADQASEDTPMPDAPKPEEKKPKTETKAKTETKTEEVGNQDPARVKADAKKAEANELYKKRQFDDAIQLYEEAWTIYKDITYLNNRAAAEFEKGDYDAAIRTEKLAVEESYELRSDYKAVAKALGRIGTSLLKQDKLEESVEYFEKSLTEHRTPDILTKLRSTQREIRQRAEQAYIDPVKAEEAREEGNRLFKEGDFPGSVKAYTEAVKRAPTDPRGYANRAAAFLKLINYPDVVRDCDKALELDPKFFKAYTRKATALNIMKQYRKSMDVLEQAREIDTEHKHTREIDDLYAKAISKRFDYREGENDEKRAERLSLDPEIDEIRRDPVMNTILQQASQDPAALRDHMKNPEVRRKINLLAAAGVIRTR